MSLQVGERYRDRYDVLQHIGEGGFAHVYRARDASSGTDVALKVLKDPHLAEHEVVERFQREVFAVASISSPHVVGLRDFGISGAGDDFFMVMDLVEGPSLRELMPRRRWSADEVGVIVGQIAHALEAAHEKGIIHRDLKPENVLLVEHSGGRWQAKVLDFGLAKLAELERTLELAPITRTGLTVGTPQYLAPEQITGQRFDGRADLFALGVITYEMLAGKRPWDGEGPREVMTAILRDPLSPAVDLHPTAAARAKKINRFLGRALAKKPDDRPASALEFFQELEKALFDGERPLGPLAEVSSQAISLVDKEPADDATQLDLRAIGGAELQRQDMTLADATRPMSLPPELALRAAPVLPPRPSRRRDFTMLGVTGALALALLVLCIWLWR